MENIMNRQEGRVLPVLIHHESNAKPQTGGKKNQEYLKYCVNQALKYNEKVVLIGDEANETWCPEWHHVKSLENEKLQHFYRVFKNLSYYPDRWAVSIYKRFFLFEEYLIRNGYEECIVLDSDILVYLDFATYKPLVQCDAAMETPENQSMEALEKKLGVPNDIRWASNVGLSYFTREALTNFLDYCIDLFENHIDVLMPKWEAHQQYNIYGGCGEMAVFYLWQLQWKKEHGDGSILNLLAPDADGYVFSGPISGEENNLRGECQVSKLTKIKTIVYKDHIPHYVKKADGSLLPTYSLHFIGGDKVYMEGMYRNERAALGAILNRHYWILRGRVGALKRHLLHQEGN